MPPDSSHSRPAAAVIDPVVLGWREWSTLPGLGIAALKAKLDTGARTSSLHVESLQTYREAGLLRVRFAVRPRRRSTALVLCAAPVHDCRSVSDSGGHRADRYFIRTEIALAGQCFAIEMNLTDRRAMLFPLLLGRSALDGRFRVDPALSYTGPRPQRLRRPPT